MDNETRGAGHAEAADAELTPDYIAGAIAGYRARFAGDTAALKFITAHELAIVRAAPGEAPAIFRSMADELEAWGDRPANPIGSGALEVSGYAALIEGISRSAPARHECATAREIVAVADALIDRWAEAFLVDGAITREIHGLRGR